MDSISTSILIIGAGPAGLAAAAAAASRSTDVSIVDANSTGGGQIWRASKGTVTNRTARRLIGEIEDAGVRLVGGAEVFSTTNDNALLAETANGTIELSYEKLIVATGARERFLPFPGWTLPGVYGAGGLQALVKGGLDVNGRRVVVSGTGALLLAVAAYLRSHGANILAIAEQASARQVRALGATLWRSPAKLAQAAVLWSRLIGIPYLTDCWVGVAHGDDRLKRIEIINANRRRSFECDLLACGFHLVPNIELAELLGCQIQGGAVVTDEFQQTSVSDVYCAGEPTGVAGVEAALIEGKIAGLAVAGQRSDAEKLFRKRDRARSFGQRLDEAFSVRNELRSLPNADTVVCRCEDVEFSRLKEFPSFRDAKLQTRCGMGPCQGRVCGPATQFLFGWEPPEVRPPIFPVKMEHL